MFDFLTRLLQLDPQQRPTAREALDEWGVTHILAGREELLRYGPNLDVRFEGFEVAFASDGVAIYEVDAQ